MCFNWRNIHKKHVEILQCWINIHSFIHSLVSNYKKLHPIDFQKLGKTYWVIREGYYETSFNIEATFAELYLGNTAGYLSPDLLTAVITFSLWNKLVLILTNYACRVILMQWSYHRLFLYFVIGTNFLFLLCNVFKQKYDDEYQI